jgi:type II restriction/modification system DNA methylase subunit YeeA
MAGGENRIAAALKKSKKQNDKAYKDAAALFHGHLERLRNFRVLDAACGSGNFLYLALKSLKDLERRANTEAEALGLQRQVSIEVSPANVLGIELDAYAAELARVTVWIGEIQWMLRNGYPVSAQPILRPLDSIENRDALIKVRRRTARRVEAEWPACDAIVGNPPFLGDKKMRGELGDGYVTEALRKCYKGRVPGGADLVTYWFEKARAQIEAGKCKRRDWSPQIRYAAAPTARCWIALSRRRASLMRGGRTMDQRRCGGTGFAGVLSVKPKERGWMACRLSAFTAI